MPRTSTRPLPQDHNLSLIQGSLPADEMCAEDTTTVGALTCPWSCHEAPLLKAGPHQVPAGESLVQLHWERWLSSAHQAGPHVVGASEGLLPGGRV